MRKFALVFVTVIAVCALGFFACDADNEHPSSRNEGITTGAASPSAKAIGCAPEKSAGSKDSNPVAEGEKTSVLKLEAEKQQASGTKLSAAKTGLRAAVQVAGIFSGNAGQVLRTVAEQFSIQTAYSFLPLVSSMISPGKARCSEASASPNEPAESELQGTEALMIPSLLLLD